jgi:hypothetical protein
VELILPEPVRHSKSRKWLRLLQRGWIFSETKRKRGQSGREFFKRSLSKWDCLSRTRRVLGPGFNADMVPVPGGERTGRREHGGRGRCADAPTPISGVDFGRSNTPLDPAEDRVRREAGERTM